MKTSKNTEENIIVISSLCILFSFIKNDYNLKGLWGTRVRMFGNGREKSKREGFLVCLIAKSEI